jgi:hypothetical protein
MNDRSILIVCSERSGSNLLKAMLNRHPEIFIGPPIPLFECFRPLISSYDDLSEAANWEELLRDAIDLISLNHQPLPCAIDLDSLRAEIASAERGWAALIRGVYRIIAASQGCPIYGYKYSTNMQDLDAFLAALPFSHVIYQVRDPRDVILSEIKSGFVDETPVAIARRWATAQADARAALEARGAKVLTQSYESLVSSPHATLARLWEFLGVAPCPDALAFHADEGNQRAADRTHVWANLARPLMRRNYRKFYREWNHAEVSEIERLIGSELVRAGYKRSWRILYRSRHARPTPVALGDSDWNYVKPQLEKWAALRDKAAARASGAVAWRS